MLAGEGHLSDLAVPTDMSRGLLSLQPHLYTHLPGHGPAHPLWPFYFRPFNNQSWQSQRGKKCHCIFSRPPLPSQAPVADRQRLHVQHRSRRRR